MNLPTPEYIDAVNTRVEELAGGPDVMDELTKNYTEQDAALVIYNLCCEHIEQGVEFTAQVIFNALLNVHSQKVPRH